MSKKPAQSADAKAGGAEAPTVQVSGWTESAPPRRRSFPGPRQTGEPLRVALSREAYAELTAHVKEHLDEEVCGVLAGELCEDEEGLFVFVQAIVPGSSAKRGGAHVTYTQETWEQIHERMGKDYPNLQIVGWYHSHPGFGVEFSDMDLFIQEHFFAGLAQIALVSDPLGGAEAICANTPTGRVHLRRFWVDGRERLCHTPARSQDAGAAVAEERPEAARALRALEERVSQLAAAIDEQRALWYRFLLMVGMTAAACIIGLTVYWIYNMYTSRLRPPELRQFVPVPVRIGDKDVLLGVAVAEWVVPPELSAAYIAVEREKQEAAEAARKKAASASQPAASAPATPPATKDQRP